MGSIVPKESDLLKKNIEIYNVRRLDLHGYSLMEANNKVKKFLIESFNLGYKKVLIVTGKGQRSKAYNDPYVSEKLSMIRYSVPEFIKNDGNLNNKVSRISQADLKDGGEGAIYIFFKK